MICRLARRRSLDAGVGLTALCCVAGPGGCSTGRAGSDISLESGRPAARVAAVIRAGRNGDGDDVGRLVDRLDDEDAAVRLYAILALERRTGTRMGFEYGGPATQRRASVDRWRRHLGTSARVSPVRPGRAAEWGRGRRRAPPGAVGQEHALRRDRG